MENQDPAVKTLKSNIYSLARSEKAALASAKARLEREPWLKTRYEEGKDETFPGKWEYQGIVAEEGKAGRKGCWDAYLVFTQPK